MRFRLLALLAALSVPYTVSAAAPTIKGYMFGDYYCVASGPDKKENSFRFGRIYLTFNKKWENAFSGRFRLEASDAGFGANSKMTPVVKDAWLSYKKEGKTLMVGLIPTPTWGITEAVWGYRPVAKTFMDRNKLGASRDTGLSFDTRLDSEGRVSALVMFGNGNSNKSEIDTHKKAYLRLKFDLSENVGTTAYADYETRPGDQDQLTLSSLLYLSAKDRAFGLLGAWQKRKNAVGGVDAVAKGFSVSGRVKTREDFGLYGRFDYFDPSDLASDDSIIRGYAGVDLAVTKEIHVMPNVSLESFEASTLESIVIPSVTLYFKF